MVCISNICMQVFFFYLISLKIIVYFYVSIFPRLSWHEMSIISIFRSLSCHCQTKNVAKCTFRELTTVLVLKICTLFGSLEIWTTPPSRIFISPSYVSLYCWDTFAFDPYWPLLTSNFKCFSSRQKLSLCSNRSVKFHRKLLLFCRVFKKQRPIKYLSFCK